MIWINKSLTEILSNLVRGMLKVSSSSLMRKKPMMVAMAVAKLNGVKLSLKMSEVPVGELLA